MTNLLVYIKTKNDKKFNALSSLKNFTYAPTLMYACLIPYEKLEHLKNWANEYKELCIKNEVSIEIRPYKKKAIYRIN